MRQVVLARVILWLTSSQSHLSTSLQQLVKDVEVPLSSCLKHNPWPGSVLWCLQQQVAAANPFLILSSIITSQPKQIFPGKTPATWRRRVLHWKSVSNKTSIRILSRKSRHSDRCSSSYCRCSTVPLSCLCSAFEQTTLQVLVGSIKSSLVYSLYSHSCAAQRPVSMIQNWHATGIWNHGPRLLASWNAR